jgi:hypothetical protein
MTLLGPVDLSSGAGEVTLDCFFSPSGTVITGSGVNFTDIQVSAIQVGTTTTTTNVCPLATDSDGDGDQNAGGVDDGDGCL